MTRAQARAVIVRNTLRYLRACVAARAGGMPLDPSEDPRRLVHRAINARSRRAGEEMPGHGDRGPEGTSTPTTRPS